MIYPIGSYSMYPRQTYDPADLATDGHLSFRSRIARAARWWGLGEDDTEEAVSQFYLHWLSRDYTTTDIPRGDHSRAMASTLAYAKHSHFHGFTGQRRQARGKRVERGSDGLPMRQSVRLAGETEMAYRQRRREAMIPGPSASMEAMERLATRGPSGRKAVKIAEKLGVSVAGLVRALYGRTDDPCPRFIPGPLPAPWLEKVPAKPMEPPVYVPDMEYYRAQLAASRADRPLVSGDPRRANVMARLRTRALLRETV